MSVSKSLLISLFAAAFLFAGCGGDSSNETSEAEAEVSISAETPHEQVMMALDDVLARIEKGEVKGMFERYTPPEDLKRLQEGNQLDVAVERFEIFKNQFVEAIKTAKAAEPQFNEDSSKVYFEVAEVPGGKVVFQKIDEKWYFSD